MDAICSTASSDWQAQFETLLYFNGFPSRKYIFRDIRLVKLLAIRGNRIACKRYNFLVFLGRLIGFDQFDAGSENKSFAVEIVIGSRQHRSEFICYLLADIGRKARYDAGKEGKMPVLQLWPINPLIFGVSSL